MRYGTFCRVKNIVAFICLLLMVVSGVWYHLTDDDAPFYIFLATLLFLFLGGWMIEVAKKVIDDLDSENDECE